MVSSTIARISAFLLLIGGVALLFLPDVILPALVPGFPTSGVWIGQLLAAAWLGVAALNWLRRNTVLGGIYGRPIVMANLSLYFIGSMALIDPLRNPAPPAALWIIALPTFAMALAYGILLLRGPFETAGQGSEGRRAA